MVDAYVNMISEIFSYLACCNGVLSYAMAAVLSYQIVLLLFVQLSYVFFSIVQFITAAVVGNVVVNFDALEFSVCYLTGALLEFVRYTNFV